MILLLGRVRDILGIAILLYRNWKEEQVRLLDCVWLHGNYGAHNGTRCYGEMVEGEESNRDIP